MYQDHTRSNKVPLYLSDTELATLEKKCSSVGANRGKLLRDLANHWQPQANDRRRNGVSEGDLKRPLFPSRSRHRVCLRQ